MMLAGSILRPALHSHLSIRFFRTTLPVVGFGGEDLPAPIGYGAVRCASTKSGGEGKKSPARLTEVQRLLYQAEERYKAAGGGVEPIPKITLGKDLSVELFIVLGVLGAKEFSFWLWREL